MDTGLSIYRQRFSGDIHWGYDLFNIGAYYAQYERITAHWRAVIPAACQMEVVYEDLARNQETISRRLIDFLDLPWDPRCLDFHKMKRCVHTASDLQVKQPMYLDSIGRWKNYRHFLDPLREGLKSGTIRAGAVTASG